MEHLLCALELAETDENLAQGRERNRETAARGNLFLLRRALLRQRERLLVPMLDQRDIGLVIQDDAQDIQCLHGRGKPFGLAQSRGRLFDSSALRQHHS